MDFASILKIPPKPAAIAEAERKWRKALAERKAAQSKHAELHRLYFGQVPGQLPRATAAEVDKAGQEIVPHQVKEGKGNDAGPWKLSEPLSMRSWRL